ncbi:MAG: hypothetical protein JWM27_3723 [Gemmatimonadetes bacterium]|nr:hypothetical protein [Gemmatimonadota bacterium]
MKKLALHLDDLAVETFRTSPDAALARGTVRGAEYSYPAYCAPTIGNPPATTDLRGEGLASNSCPMMCCL